MLRISNIRTKPDESLTKETLAAFLRIPPEEIQTINIVRRGIDARRKTDIHFVYTVEAVLRHENRFLGRKNVQKAEKKIYVPPEYPPPGYRPVIAGSGPAGLFCGLMLAYAGAKPIILERGQDVDKRMQAVEKFWKTGELNPECNVQFGEGGAGTFSDGKLTTGIQDIRCRRVLEEFCKFGADAEILYEAKPHIGTDRLTKIIRNMRREIESRGGEFRFGHRLTGLKIENGQISGAYVTDSAGEYLLKTQSIVAAIGHSARDTLQMLYDAGLKMEQKAFSVGVRIEHRQTDIDQSQYGAMHTKLPAADYKLAVHLPDGRGVYTFCMCPGGVVVGAASEDGGVVTNGMSYHARDGENSNSALLVSVTPADFPDGHPLAGVTLQRQIEKRAWEVGGKTYFAPAQLAGDFLENRPSVAAGTIQPSYKPGVVWSEIDKVLPPFAANALREALPLLDKKLKGFANPDAVLTAPETRSSSPVRICRNPQTLESNVGGFYPCGEGAGYAGGIMSAAVDGIRVFEAVLQNSQKF